MYDATRAFVDELLGLELEGSDLLFRHMVWRTFIVVIVAVALARLGARRFLSHNAGFDVMVAIVLGSVLSRGINGDARFVPSLGAAGVLLLLHHLLASFAFRSHRISKLLKGSPQVLVRNGVLDREQMARAKITDDDLEAGLRLAANVTRVEDVMEARLERSGSISVVPNSGARGGNASTGGLHSDSNRLHPPQPHERRQEERGQN